MKSRRFSSDPQLLTIETKKTPLMKGASGSGVAQIQVFLHLIGHRLPKSITGGQPDGIFGSETEALVKRFQSDGGLKPDGLVGPLTLAAMDRVLLEKPFLDTVSPVSYSAAVLAGNGRRLSDRPVHFD